MTRWVITLVLASAFVGGLATPARAGTISYLDDGVVRVGVDLDRGGLIVYLAPSGTDPSANLVDATTGDEGIQPWFQAGPDGFDNPAPPYQSNPWNPSACASSCTTTTTLRRRCASSNCPHSTSIRS